MGMGLAGAYGVAGGHEALQKLLAERFLQQMQERQQAEVERRNKATEGAQAQQEARLTEAERTLRTLENRRVDLAENDPNRGLAALKLQTMKSLLGGAPQAGPTFSLMPGDQKTQQRTLYDFLGLNPNTTLGPLRTPGPGIVWRSPQGAVRIGEDNSVTPIPQGGRQLQGYTPPDRVLVQTDQGLVPRPDAAAAAKGGAPMQPPLPASVRTRMNMADKIVMHVDDAITEIEEADKKGLLGPVLGRWSDFLANKVGSTGDPEVDRLMGNLMFDLSGLRTGFANVHGGARGGGSIQMVQVWKDIFNSRQMSKERLLGALEKEREWLKTYGSGKEPTKPAFRVLSVEPVK